MTFQSTEVDSDLENEADRYEAEQEFLKEMLKADKESKGGDGADIESEEIEETVYETDPQQELDDDDPYIWFGEWQGEDIVEEY